MTGDSYIETREGLDRLRGKILELVRDAVDIEAGREARADIPTAVIAFPGVNAETLTALLSIASPGSAIAWRPLNICADPERNSLEVSAGSDRPFEMVMGAVSFAVPGPLAASDIADVAAAVREAVAVLRRRSGYKG